MNVVESCVQRRVGAKTRRFKVSIFSFMELQKLRIASATWGEYSGTSVEDMNRKYQGVGNAFHDLVQQQVNSPVCMFYFCSCGYCTAVLVRAR